jgi:hypothetical protein
MGYGGIFAARALYNKAARACLNNGMRMAIGTRRMAAWLGVAAVTFHAIVPLAGMAAFGAPAAVHAHSGHGDRGHAQEGNHTPHEPAAHAAGGRALQHDPGVPDSFCIGDCPCCASGDRTTAAAPAHTASLLAPALQERPQSLDAPRPITEVAYAPPARGPPRHS